MTQRKARPPSFTLFGNQLDALPDAYLRYLSNGLRETFDLPGHPAAHRVDRVGAALRPDQPLDAAGHAEQAGGPLLGPAQRREEFRTGQPEPVRDAGVGAGQQFGGRPDVVQAVQHG